MEFSAHLRRLKAYAKKHGSPPSLQAASLMLGIDEAEAEQIFAAARLSPLAEQSIAAGQPSALSDALEASLNLHDYLAPFGARAVIVPVSGDSMVNAGILDGDLAVIGLGGEARPGDIVAAEIDGQLTLKRLATLADGSLALRAENPRYGDIALNESFRVHGVLLGLARKY